MCLFFFLIDCFDSHMAAFKLSKRQPKALDSRVALASVMAGYCGLMRSSMVTVAKELKADDMVLHKNEEAKQNQIYISDATSRKQIKAFNTTGSTPEGCGSWLWSRFNTNGQAFFIFARLTKSTTPIRDISYHNSGYQTWFYFLLRAVCGLT